MRAGRHLRERVRVDEMTRARGRGRGKDDVRGAREELVERTHDPHAFDGARRIRAAERAYFHAEGMRPGGDGATDATQAYQGDGRPFDALQGGDREVPVLRWLRQERLRKALRPRQDRRHDPFRDRHRAGSARAGDDPIVIEHRGRNVVDPGARELDPANPGCVEPGENRVPTEITTEEGVGLQSIRRLAAGEVHELDVGKRVPDASGFGRGRTQLGDDPHDGRS